MNAYHASTTSSIPTIATVVLVKITCSSVSFLLRPDILLILITAPHVLHQFLPFLETNASLLTDDFPQYYIYLPRHVRRVTANVKISLSLLQQFVNKNTVLLKTLLDIDLLFLLTGKGRKQGKRWA